MFCKNSVLSFSEKIGLPGPLLTCLSGVNETTKISPNFFADLKCFICQYVLNQKHHDTKQFFLIIEFF